MSSLFPSLTLLCLLVIECRGDCARSATIPEAMGITPYKMWEGDDPRYLDNALIAKLSFAYDEDGDAKKVSTEPCSFEVYQSGESESESGYVNIDMVPVYTIQEIFVGVNTTKGEGGVTVGDEIPILYSTDTGSREDLPSRLNDKEGFLGVLNLKGYCFVDGEHVKASSMAQQLYTMSECNSLLNIPWPDVSKEDRELLRNPSQPSSQPSFQPSSQPVSNAFSSTLTSFGNIIIMVAAITLF